MQSKCSACNATRFEITKADIANASRRFDFVRCAACGAVVGTAATGEAKFEAALAAVGEAVNVIVERAVAAALASLPLPPSPDIAGSVRGRESHPRELVTTQAVADYFGVCTMTVHRWGTNGCPRKRVGGTWRYRLTEVEAWHETRRG